MPRATAVAAAMRKYTPQRNPVLGQWVGPSPRVTRKPVLGGFETDVAWLYAWPDTDYSLQNLPVLKRNLHDQVKDGVKEMGWTWSDPVLIPYSATVHGSANWWATGQASQTHTRDESATGIARLDTPENPVGPTTDDTHPTTLVQGAQAVGRGIGDLFNSPIVWVIAGGVLLFMAYPYVKPFLARADRAAA